jgi:glycine cleavage system H protein
LRLSTIRCRVSLPAPGTELAEGEELAHIESQKTTVTVTAPCQLKVVCVNEHLASDPMRVRMESFGAGWLVQAELAEGGWEKLLDEVQYRNWVRHQDAAGGDQN